MKPRTASHSITFCPHEENHRLANIKTAYERLGETAKSSVKLCTAGRTNTIDSSTSWRQHHNGLKTGLPCKISLSQSEIQMAVQHNYMCNALYNCNGCFPMWWYPHMEKDQKLAIVHHKPLNCEATEEDILCTNGVNL